MKLLHRYVMRSVLLATLASVGIFVFVAGAVNAARDVGDYLASGQIGFDQFLAMWAMLVPFGASFAMPMSVLIGVLVVMGRLSARQEIVAMKAAGMSIWRISAGVIGVTLLCTFAGGLVFNYVSPVARVKYFEMLGDAVQADPLRLIVPGRFVREIPDTILYAGGRSGDSLRDVWVWKLAPNGQALWMAKAESGTISYDERTMALVLVLRQVVLEPRSENNPDDLATVRPGGVAEEVPFTFSLENFMGFRGEDTRARSQKLSNMTLIQLMERRGELADELSSLRAAGAGPEAQQPLRSEIARAGYYISRNMALSLSPIALALVAIPLSIKASRSETYANIAIALGLALLYYMLLGFTGWVERSPELLPHVVVWLPNILFQALGLGLLWRANRH